MVEDEVADSLRPGTEMARGLGADERRGDGLEEWIGRI